MARQPIFRVPDGPQGSSSGEAEVLAGYELLFRDGPANTFPQVDGDAATSRLLHDSFFSSDFEELVDHTLGFVNFTRDHLVRRTPKLFPARGLVVEVLESVPADAEVLRALQDLRSEGYRLVLDDFAMTPGREALVDLAWMIKFDVRTTPLAAIASCIERFKNRDIRFLAEKVETRAEVAALKAVGCTWFQGYYFARPESVARTAVAPGMRGLLRLMQEAMRPGQDLGALEDLIASDVSVSYKLLRYVNSAYFARPTAIESIRQALLLLGEREARQLVLLMATARMATRKPRELMRLAVVRGRMAEHLTVGVPEVSHEDLFVVGLLSSIDAVTDRPMGELLGELPLSEAVKVALTRRGGVLGTVLSLVLAYERADWGEVGRLADAVGLTIGELPAAHQAAVRAGAAFLEAE